MIPYQTYQLWQLERLKTVAELHVADAQRGMFAAAASRSARQAAGTTIRAAARSRLHLARALRLAKAQPAARVI